MAGLNSLTYTAEPDGISTRIGILATHRFRPRALALEDRTLPSVTAAGDFYWADGRQVPLRMRDGQYAVQLEAGASVAALTAERAPLAGFHVVRSFGDSAAIVQADAGPRLDAGLWAVADSAAWGARPEIAWAAPVFESIATGGWLVTSNEVAVRLRPGVAADTFFDDDARFSSYRPLLGTPDQFVATTAAAGGRPVLSLANELMADPRLLWATPNWMIESHLATNDPLYGQQWHLNNTGQSGGTADADVDAPEAWAVTAGSPNIVIADIDDAIQRDHPDLAPNVWVNPGEVAGNGVDDDGNGYVDDARGWDFWDNDSNPSPNAGSGDHHGTATAGVAVAAGNNNLGGTGVAYGARLMPIRSNIVPALSPPDVPSAVYYAAGRTANGLGTWRGADVLTCSWLFDAPFQPLSDAIAWASANGRGGKGLPIFIASGNGGNGAVGYPANLAGSLGGVIAVGGSSHNDNRVSYSQYGPDLDFLAPTAPGGITTTDRTGSAGYSSGDYTSGFSGTSSATPLAAGIGALALSRDPALTAAQLRGLLRNTTDLVGPLAYDPATGKNLQYGYGRVNANVAVRGVGVREIQVLDGPTDVADGTGILDFNAAVGGFVEKTLRVRNQGTLDLTLGSISLAPGPFTVVSGFGDTVLSVGESTTFTVRYAPTAGSVSTQVLSFATNDADEGTFDLTLRGPLRVQSVQVNGGAAQRSRVASLSVTFSAEATFAREPANAFRLDRIGGATVGSLTATAATVGGVTVVTLTNFAGAETVGGSLADGRYTLTVVASEIMDPAALDGNGNGVGGDDHVLNGTALNGLFRYYGDFDGDGDTDGSDVVLYVPTIFNGANYAAQFDFDNDGDVDGSDLVEFVANLFVPLP